MSVNSVSRQKLHGYMCTHVRNPLFPLCRSTTGDPLVRLPLGPVTFRPLVLCYHSVPNWLAGDCEYTSVHLFPSTEFFTNGNLGPSCASSRRSGNAQYYEWVLQDSFVRDKFLIACGSSFQDSERLETVSCCVVTTSPCRCRILLMLCPGIKRARENESGSHRQRCCSA